MADNNHHRRSWTKTNMVTGKLKWLDSQGIGYIVPDNPFFPEVYVTPSSLSSNIIFREGDCVKFSFNLCGKSKSIHPIEAVNVIPFGTKCTNCKGFGHYIWNCPLSFVSILKCFRCGLIGHLSKYCDQKFRGWPYHWDSPKEISISHGSCDGRSWSSLFGGTRSGGVKLGHTSNSIVCVKKKKDVKKVEEVEDCFILEFNPTLDDDNDDDDDDGGGDVKSIVCVKKSEDVKKIEEVEDCFILDFDPFEDKFSNLSLCDKSKVVADKDDVTILAAKGKVACRDYPHSRHQCATHPFKKTPHELHCEMCYCFICDIPAPCKNWNNTSEIHGLNHCHATNESSSWRKHRDLVKKQSKVG